MAYLSIPIPQGEWVEIASESKTLTIFTLGHINVYAYEGTIAPSVAPEEGVMTQPFVKVSNGSNDLQDTVQKIYNNIGGEKLWMYSTNSPTKVIIQN